jgi:hypothetical protein
VPSPAPCLLQLRRQVDAQHPTRSRLSDGIMGDASHRRRRSDHNLGNALDLTHSPGTGFDAGALGDALRRQMASHPAGRVTYVIFNGRIASPLNNWEWRRYTGPNKHQSHIHISVKASARNEIRPWKLT